VELSTICSLPGYRFDLMSQPNFTFTNGRLNMRLLFLLVLLLPFMYPSYNTASSVVGLEQSTPFDMNTDGYANLQEGKRLFQLGFYDEASAYFWRAVLLQEKAKETVSVRSMPMKCGFLFTDIASYSYREKHTL